MSPAPGGGLFHNLKGDVSGGVAAAIITLPVAISCGLVAFAPLGPDYAATGALAGLYAGIFVTVFAALFGGTPLQISGPKSSLAVILAALVAGLVHDPMLPQDPDGRVAMVVILVFLCIVMGGVFQIAFGVFRLGTIIKFIPYPVTVGFMNGLAIIIVLSQVPVFLEGPEFGFSAIMAENTAVQPKAVFVGLVGFVTMLIARRWLKRGGDAILALLAGSAAYYILASVGGPEGLGGVIGRMPMQVPTPDKFVSFLAVIGDPNFTSLLSKIVPPAFVLGLLGSIESLLSAVAMDTRSATRHDSNRELMGQGVGNIVSGCFGGLAGGGSLTRSTASYTAGGRTRLASGMHGLLFLGAVTAVGPVVGLVPLAATAGILFVYAIRLADNWTRQLIAKVGRDGVAGSNRDMHLDLGVVFLVTVLTVATDLIVAVGVGFIAAMFQFIVRTGQEPVYRYLRGDTMHSKNARPLEMMETLKDKGRAIVLVEAQGPIFFGSAERLAAKIEAFADDSDIIILDFRRVTDIDVTGAQIVARLDQFMANKGKVLLISHLPPGRPLSAFLRDMEVIRPDTEDRVFADADAALAWAEDRMLASVSGDAGREIPLEDLEIMAGMSEQQFDLLRTFLVRREFEAGACILKEGEEGDAMYFIASGAVSVRGRLSDGERTVRLAGIGPGLVFGEMAILGDFPRTASVVADDAVVCYALTRDAFKEISYNHTDVGIKLLLNLGRQSAHRLEITSEQVRALER